MSTDAMWRATVFFQCPVCKRKSHSFISMNDRKGKRAGTGSFKARPRKLWLNPHEVSKCYCGDNGQRKFMNLLSAQVIDISQGGVLKNSKTTKLRVEIALRCDADEDDSSA